VNTVKFSNLKDLTKSIINITKHDINQSVGLNFFINTILNRKHKYCLAGYYAGFFYFDLPYIFRYIAHIQMDMVFVFANYSSPASTVCEILYSIVDLTRKSSFWATNVSSLVSLHFVCYPKTVTYRKLLLLLLGLPILGSSDELKAATKVSSNWPFGIGVSRSELHPTPIALLMLSQISFHSKWRSSAILQFS